MKMEGGWGEAEGKSVDIIIDIKRVRKQADEGSITRDVISPFSRK